MEVLLHLTRGFAFWETIIALMVTTAMTALASMALLVISPLGEGESAGVGRWAALGLVFLNGGNVLLIAMNSFVASDRTILNSADSFWPQVPSYTALGVGLMINILFAGVIVLDPDLFDRQWIYLFLLAVTNLLLCANAAFTAAISPHITDANRWLPIAFYFVHINAIAHVVIAIISIRMIIEITNGSRISGDVAVLIPTIWIELTAISSVLALLNWQQPRAVFTMLAAVVLAIVFGVACFYASPFYAGGPYSGTWYPVALTAIPLLLFLAILLRRCRLRSRNRP